MRSGAAAGVRLSGAGVGGRERGDEARDRDGDTAIIGTGEHRLIVVGLGVIRVRSGCDRAKLGGKWKTCGGSAVGEAAAAAALAGGGWLMDLGCCCCPTADDAAGWARTGDAESSLGFSALDRTSCRMSGSSRANIVADAMNDAPTEGEEGHLSPGKMNVPKDTQVSPGKHASQSVRRTGSDFSA